MNTTSALKTNSATSLAEAVRQFGTTKKYCVLLEHHRDDVLDLRARGATYPKIRELLLEYDIDVSESAIVRFCHKHQAELKRRLLALESSPELNSTPSLSSPQPQPTDALGRFRDLRGPV